MSEMQWTQHMPSEQDFAGHTMNELKSELAQRNSAEPPLEEDLQGARVLVIDDNRDGADILGMLIEEQGGVVRVAYDGDSGLLTARDFKPDAVLLDIGLPDMDGYEVCRRLRAQFGSAVGLISLTGWGQERDKQRALDSGFDAHLTKPADPDQLSETIRALKSKSLHTQV